jgi:murein DD-endopeptidase MepM/ murein hydrolase activator NlpD
MSQPYQGRHRNVPTRGRRAHRSSGLTKAIRRPAVTSSVLLAVVATTAAGYQAADQRQTGAAAFTVSTEAIAQANELADAQIEDTARLAADRNSTNSSMAAAQEKDRVAAIAAERAADKARREQAKKVAREKARKALAAKKQAILANAQADPRAAAQALLPEFGFDESQWGCLDNLWMGESGWRYTAENSSSGAYGIPQSLPGSKMASAGADWRTTPVTQIKWGLGYIQERYGSPCGAWGFKQGHGWY